MSFSLMKQGTRMSSTGYLFEKLKLGNERKKSERQYKPEQNAKDLRAVRLALSAVAAYVIMIVRAPNPNRHIIEEGSINY